MASGGNQNGVGPNPAYLLHSDGRTPTPTMNGQQPKPVRPPRKKTTGTGQNGEVSPTSHGLSKTGTDPCRKTIPPHGGNVESVMSSGVENQSAPSISVKDMISKPVSFREIKQSGHTEDELSAPGAILHRERLPSDNGDFSDAVCSMETTIPSDNEEICGAIPYKDSTNLGYEDLCGAVPYMDSQVINLAKTQHSTDPNSYTKPSEGLANQQMKPVVPPRKRPKKPAPPLPMSDVSTEEQTFSPEPGGQIVTTHPNGEIIMTHPTGGVSTYKNLTDTLKRVMLKPYKVCLLNSQYLK